MPDDKEELSKKIADEMPDAGLRELLAPQAPEKSAALMKCLAAGVWAITVFLASRSSISPEILGSTSARGEFLGVSTLGLLIILFSNEATANFVGFRPFFASWVPINKKTPLPVLRLFGWMLLIGVAGIFLFN